MMKGFRSCRYVYTYITMGEREELSVYYDDADEVLGLASISNSGLITSSFIWASVVVNLLLEALSIAVTIIAPEFVAISYKKKNLFFAKYHCIFFEVNDQYFFKFKIF